jgi:hypothetical protein
VRQVIVARSPATCAKGHSESSSLRIFRERFDYPLVGSVPVDFAAVGLYNRPTNLPCPKPSVAAGTHLNSYILHSDPPGKNPLAATFGFTTDALGVQVLSDTLIESQAIQLRAAGT